MTTKCHLRVIHRQTIQAWGRLLKTTADTMSYVVKKGRRRTFGAVSSTFGLFSISHNPSLKPFLLLGLAYFSLLGWYGKMSFGPRNALLIREREGEKKETCTVCSKWDGTRRLNKHVTPLTHSSNIYVVKESALMKLTAQSGFFLGFKSSWTFFFFFKYTSHYMQI